MRPTDNFEGFRLVQLGQATRVRAGVLLVRPPNDEGIVRVMDLVAGFQLRILAHVDAIASPAEEVRLEQFGLTTPVEHRTCACSYIMLIIAITIHHKRISPRILYRI